jgi:tRNA(Arg) A34 adenosine deaminase TadA
MSDVQNAGRIMEIVDRQAGAAMSLRCDTLAPMPEGANPEFLRRAIRLATQNVTTGAGGPFAALVARDGQIVAEAANTVTAAHDPTAHAEVNAIRAAAKALGTFTLAGCEIYSSCQPCPMCLAACYWARLDAVYYGASAADASRAGFDDAFLYEELRKDQAARSLPARQLLGDEAWSSFAAWLVSAKKIEY